MSLKRVLPAVLVLLVAVAGAVQSRQAARQDFWALNSTGKAVQQFYVSPHSARDWGSDVLGRATLPNGMGTLISFSPRAHVGCVFDFKLVYGDGTSDTYTQGKDVCNVLAILFAPNELMGLVHQQ